MGYNHQNNAALMSFDAYRRYCGIGELMDQTHRMMGREGFLGHEFEWRQIRRQMKRCEHDEICEEKSLLSIPVELRPSEEKIKNAFEMEWRIWSSSKKAKPNLVDEKWWKVMKRRKNELEKKQPENNRGAKITPQKMYQNECNLKRKLINLTPKHFYLKHFRSLPLLFFQSNFACLKFWILNLNVSSGHFPFRQTIAELEF